MNRDFDTYCANFDVVVNDEEQYSIWDVDRTPPAGWRRLGKSGTKEECLAYISGVWTDITPLSIRRRSETKPGP